MKFIPFIMLTALCYNSIAQSQIDTVQVEAYMQLSNGAFFKTLALKTSNSNIEAIEDFDFEWGYDYTLVVEEERMQPPLQDASAYRHKLISVIDKKEVVDDFIFEMWIDNTVYLSGESGAAFEKISASSYNYHSTVSVVILQEHQEEFNELLSANKPKKGKFKFIGKNKIQLVAIL